jgi:hypothetical protein
MNELTKEERIIAALESFTQGGHGVMFNFHAESFGHNYGLQDIPAKEIERVYEKWDRGREKKMKKLRKLFTC